MSYWRFDSKVGLKGVEGTLTVADDCYGKKVYTPNPTNPTVLTDDVILYALRTSRRARLDFNRIFPTLLQLIGYQRQGYLPLYGPSLSDPDKDPFSYNLRFNTLLGRQPEWQVIDLKQIVDPPVSDYRGS